MADKEYGLKIKDASGNACVITPELGTVIASGRVTMPTGLVDTNKYYTSIDLPGIGNIPYADLIVFANAVDWTPRVFPTYLPGAFIGAYYWSYVLDDNYTYYSKNESTGVLSVYTAGDRTFGDPDKWHLAISAYPLVYWEKLGATQGTDIKIFAATCYPLVVCTDGVGLDIDDSNEFVYTISTNGITTIDYMVMLKKYNY